MHWWAQDHRKSWNTTESNCGWCRKNSFAGKEHFHNSWPDEVLPPGGRRICVSQQAREGFSRIQYIQRVHNKMEINAKPQKQVGQVRVSKKICTALEQQPMDRWDDDEDEKRGIWMLMNWNIPPSYGMGIYGCQWNWIASIYWEWPKQHMNPEEYRAPLSSPIQPKASKLIIRCCTDGQWAVAYFKSKPELS